MGTGQLRVATDKFFGHIVAQGASYTGYLQTMCEAVVNEDASREREYLCFVLQSAEWCREYQTVVIALKFSAIVLVGGVVLLHAQSFVRNELLPVHGCKSNLKKADHRVHFRKICGRLGKNVYFCAE